MTTNFSDFYVRQLSSADSLSHMATIFRDFYSKQLFLSSSLPNICVKNPYKGIFNFKICVNPQDGIKIYTVPFDESGLIESLQIEDYYIEGSYDYPVDDNAENLNRLILSLSPTQFKAIIFGDDPNHPERFGNSVLILLTENPQTIRYLAVDGSQGIYEFTTSSYIRMYISVYEKDGLTYTLARDIQHVYYLTEHEYDTVWNDDTCCKLIDQQSYNEQAGIYHLYDFYRATFYSGNNRTSPTIQFHQFVSIYKINGLPDHGLTDDVREQKIKYKWLDLHI